MGLVLALARFLHLLTFATIYGSSLWVTFVSGIILSKNIPRQQFGFVQSRMFPVYLRVVAAGEGLLFLLHSIMHPWLSADTLERQQFQNFVWMIAATLVNVYLLEPRATKVSRFSSLSLSLSLSLSQLDLQISFKHTYIARVDAWQLEIALVQQSFFIHNTQALIKTPFYVVKHYITEC